MITANGRNLCNLCFEPLSQSSRCTSCDCVPNIQKVPGSLREGLVLAGRYAVGKVLGKGGFGVTYLCYDLKDNKTVAIKEYLPDSLAHRNTGATAVSLYKNEAGQAFTEGATKFYEEAKLLSRFNGNPNIISVYEFFYENNTAYFVMEYLRGMDLKHYIANKGRKLPEGEATYIFNRVCDALLIVHSTGILHRDISPDNIFLCEDGSVKLLDFGAARQVVGEASKSLSIILKQGFAPLEQYQKKGNQGPWTDIYALGSTLYYALTGKIPDDAMTRLDDPNFDTAGISPAFVPIVSKMMAVKIPDRYQSIPELKQAMLALGPETRPAVDTKITYGFCSNCGKKILAGQHYCDKCRAELAARPRPAQPPQRPGQPIPNSGQPAPRPGQPIQRPVQYPGQPIPNSGQPVPRPGQPIPRPVQPIPRSGQPIQRPVQPVQPVQRPIQPIPQSGQPTQQTQRPAPKPTIMPEDLSEKKTEQLPDNPAMNTENRPAAAANPQNPVYPTSMGGQANGGAPKKSNKLRTILIAVGASVAALVLTLVLIFANGNKVKVPEDAVFNEGLAAYANSDGQYGFINDDGEIKIDCQYDYAGNFSNGCAAVLKDGKWGYINVAGGYVVEPRFEKAEAFNGKVAKVTLLGKHGLILDDGSYLLDTSYSTIYAFDSNGLAKIYKDSKYGMVSNEGKIVAEARYDSIGDFKDGYAEVKNGGKIGRISSKGILVADAIYDEIGEFDSCNMAKTKIGDLYGFVSADGYTITPEYKDALNFRENMAAVVKDGDVGFINTKGVLVVPMIYERVWSFSEGMACVVKNGKCGFVDTTGELVIACEFASATEFKNGVSTVSYNGQQYKIDKTGKYVGPAD